MNQPKHDCCAPALTTTKLFAAWDEAKRALGQDANQAGQLAMRLIANGEKPTLEQLGERLAWARERLAAALDRLEDAGLVTRDGHAGPQIAFYDTGSAPARSDARALSVSEAMRLGRRIWSDAP